MWLLEQFNSEDLKIIDDNTTIKNYLSKELETIDNGTAEFIFLEELDKVLEERILKYENKKSLGVFLIN